MNLYLKNIFNGVFFYIGWFYIVYSAAKGQTLRAAFFAFVYLLFHVLVIDRRKKEAILIGTLLGAGFLLDTSFIQAGVIEYRAKDFWMEWAAPLWVLGIHGIFATTINHSLSWLKFQPFLAAPLGGLGAFFTYVAGQKLGAVTFLLPGLQSAFIIGAIWFIYCPLVYAYAKWLEERT